MEEFDIAVIGGGPAGIMAAIAASADSNVVLLEKNSSLGHKLLILSLIHISEPTRH